MEDFSSQQIKALTSLMKQVATDEGQMTRDFVEQKIQTAKTQIIESVSEMIGGSLLSQIEDLDQSVTDVERRLLKLEEKSV